MLVGAIAGYAERVSRIARYEVLEEIARGGMGVVYRARHLDRGEVVALKVLLTHGEAQAQRLLREGNALCHLRHPHIVGVREVGYFEGRPFLALEFVAGESLESRLVTGGPLPLDEVLLLGRILADALSCAHGQRILHRDVKPSNVLLRHDGAPVLGDFGLAKDLEAEQGLTKSSVLQGSPGYWSPEQAAGQGKSAGPASDVFSLGATLYACLTGHPPHSAGSMVEAAIATVNQPPRPPSELRAEIPAALEALTLRCLAKEPALRPTAGELASALAELEESADASPEESRGPILISLGVVGVLALVLAFLLTRDAEPSPAPPPLSPPPPSASPTASSLDTPPEASPMPSPSTSTAETASQFWQRALSSASREEALELGERAAALGDLDAKTVVGGWLLSNSEGVSAERQARARGWLEEAAAAGREQAAALLGSCYVQGGLGVSVDHARAAEYLERAPSMPNARATLGVILLEGQGLERDLPRGRRLLREVAGESSLAALTLGKHLVMAPEHQREPGEARALLGSILDAGKRGSEAHFWLGTSYEAGRAGNMDKGLALDHYLKAGLGGHALSYVRGGRLLRARGGEKGLELARKAFERGVQLGALGAQRELGRMTLAGEAGLGGGAKAAFRYFAADAKRGDAASFLEMGVLLRDGSLGGSSVPRALQCFEQAGKVGDPEGYFRVGHAYQFAKGVKRDYAKAVRFYELAIAGGHAWAMTNLGSMRRLGLGAKRKDPEAAIALYRRAIELGNGRSMARLATMLEAGEGIDPDPVRGRELWEASAEAGDPVGLLELGRRREQGKGGPQDLAAARSLYRRAATSRARHLSVQQARVELARCLSEGLGGPVDLPGARDFLQRAARAGHAPAKERLAELGED